MKRRTLELLACPACRFAKMYDRISPIYGGGAALMYALVGHWQRKLRRQLLDRPAPFEGRVIEISIGRSTSSWATPKN